jgi:TPR repeat protein
MRPPPEALSGKVVPAPIRRVPEPVLRSEASANVNGEAIVLTIVRGEFFVERVPGTRAYNQGLRNARPLVGADVTLNMQGNLNVIGGLKVDFDGSPLGRDRLIRHGKTDNQGQVEFTLTDLPPIAIPADGRAFGVTIDGENRLASLKGELGMVLWRAIAANPASSLAATIPLDFKRMLDRADEYLSHCVDRDDLSAAADTLNEFDDAERMVRQYAPYAARDVDLVRAAKLRVRHAARTIEIEARERSIPNETPEARKRRLEAERNREELLSFQKTLRTIKEQGRALPAAPCAGGHVPLRPFRADGAWIVGAKECADSPAAAFAIYEAGCNGGSVADCYNLGVAYLHGYGGQPDIAKAHSLFDQVCADGWPAGCARGNSYATACDDGDIEVCLPLILGSNADQILKGLTAVMGLVDTHGPLYEVLDEFMRTDPVRSRGLFEVRRFVELSCFRGYAQGCNELGFMFQNALDWPRDLTGAARMYAKGCSTGALQACSRLGNLYGLLRDFDYDVKVQTATCEAGAGAGCTALAALYKKGLGVPQDDGRAQALYKQACLFDDGAACAELVKSR